MGQPAFAQKHFAAFNSTDDPDSRDLLRNAHKMVMDAAEGCVAAMSNDKFFVARRQFDPDYLGAEIVGDPSEDFSEKVHFSIGLSKGHLGVYVILEPKNLVKRFLSSWKADKAKFQDEFFQLLNALPTIHGWIEPVITTTQKWFFIRGLRSYQEDMIVPVSSLSGSVSFILERLDHLMEAKDLKMQLNEFHPDKNYKSKSVWGTLLIEYRFMPEFVILQGENIREPLQNAFRALIPLYRFIRSEVVITKPN